MFNYTEGIAPIYGSRCSTPLLPVIRSELAILTDYEIQGDVFRLEYPGLYKVVWNHYCHRFSKSGKDLHDKLHSLGLLGMLKTPRGEKIPKNGEKSGVNKDITWGVRDCVGVLILSTVFEILRIASNGRAFYCYDYGLLFNNMEEKEIEDAAIKSIKVFDIPIRFDISLYQEQLNYERNEKYL